MALGPIPGAAATPPVAWGRAHPGQASPSGSLPFSRYSARVGSQLLPSPGPAGSCLAPRGGGLDWEPQLRNAQMAAAAPREDARIWGESGYGKAGGKAPALPTPRESGKVAREARRRLQEQELSLASAKVATGSSQAATAGRFRRNGPFSPQREPWLLRTDTLSCGATSAVSRARLLTRVCRTGPRGAKRRERITARGRE